MSETLPKRLRIYETQLETLYPEWVTFYNPALRSGELAAAGWKEAWAGAPCGRPEVARALPDTRATLRTPEIKTLDQK